MKITSILKPALFIYEFFKFTVFIIIILILGDKQEFTITMVFTAPILLFPLMTLFICIDAERYKAYLPLYIAGKCFYIFVLLLWFILSKQVTIFDHKDSISYIAQLIFSGDLCSLAVILIIRREAQKLQN